MSRKKVLAALFSVATVLLVVAIVFFVAPGENRLENTVSDTAGLTANYALYNDIDTSNFTSRQTLDEPDFPVVGDEPTIVVLTPFPHGTVTQSFVDIEYAVTHSEWETIYKVYYSINGDFYDYIFLAGGSGVTPMGTLGWARVFIIPGENRFEFTVVDTAGLTATYTVQNVPYFDEGFRAPSPDPDFMEPARHGYYFFSNRLLIFAVRHIDSDIETEIEAAIESVGGTIVGRAAVLNLYTIEIAPRSEDELISLGQYLVTSFPHLFRSAHLSTLDDTTTELGDEYHGNEYNGTE